MKFKDKYNVAPEFENLFSFKSKKEEIEHEAKMIMFRFINSLRGFISSLTANAPFGKYILPSIDVNNLFQQKVNTLKKNNQAKKKKATKKS